MLHNRVAVVSDMVVTMRVLKLGLLLAATLQVRQFQSAQPSTCSQTTLSTKTACSMVLACHACAVLSSGLTGGS